MANTVPSCYRSRVGFYRTRFALARPLGLAVLSAVASVACSRTGLDELESSSTAPAPSRTKLRAAGRRAPEAAAAEAAVGGAGEGGTVVVSPPAFVDAPTPVGAIPDAAPTITEPPPPTKVPNCTPSDETCNGIDDDCNGIVDDGLPPIPCPSGGSQYCVAGRYSACPQRCETCIPGSQRVCFLPYCTYWATETCASDGRSFGTCKEEHVPDACSGVSSAHKESRELEQCCIDHGYCCHDDYDLDGDGDHNDMVGRCDEVTCHP